MANQVTLTFAGESKELSQEAKKASTVLDDVGKSATSAASDFEKAGKESAGFTDRIGKLGAGVSGMTDAVDSAGAAMQAMADIQSASKNRAAALARAQADVEQAMIDGKQAAVDLEQATNDLNQAQTDGAQAGLDFEQAQNDLKQANLDAKTAQDAYNTAVKEHGKNSSEAQQALIDLNQANLDAKQANIDATQATNDAKQAQTDAKQATLDATQATRDGKDAQLDLNDAMSEAHPPELQQWADKIQMVTPLLSGLIGITGLITAAQWAWNAAQAASPTTWIVLAIVALIGVIILIVTHLDVVKKVWHNVWNGIKSAAAAVGSWFKNTLWGQWIKPAWDSILHGGQNVWNWMKNLPKLLKGAFTGLFNILTWPFRTAFNFISDAWNNTIGGLHWQAPSILGGWSIDVPNLPHFHGGGTASGAMGGEFLAVLRSGETVNANGGDTGADMVHVTVTLDGNTLIDGVSKAVRKRGGNVQLVLGGRNA